MACVLGAALVFAVDVAARPSPAAAESATGDRTVATVAEARQLAKSTGQPVTVGSMLSERRTVQAAPDGSFVATEHLRPVRARVGGSWKPVDTTLEAVNGGFAPRASTADLRISGGGDGPLVSMSRAGRSLRFSWPSTLPVPSIDGDKAIFRSVIDDVDLIVKADVDGFSHVLRVATPEAAADPRLKRLTLGLHGSGLKVAREPSGTLRATDANSGGAVFEAPQPIMWDSRGAADGAEARSAQTTADDPVDGPPEGAQVAEVDVEVASDNLTLIPDQGLLLGEETVFPVYVDPVWKTVSQSAWAMVSSGYATEPYWKFKGATTEGVGYCDVGWDYRCVKNQKKRVMFRLPASAFAGKHIIKATFTAYNTKSYNCTDDRRVDLWRVGAFSPSTTWSNDNWVRYVANRSVSFCTKHPVEFSGTNLDDEVQRAANSGNSTISFGLKAANETTMATWKRFADEAHLRVRYNIRPPQPGTGDSELVSDPGGTCTGPTDPKAVNALPKMQAHLVNNESGEKLFAQFGVGWDANDDGSVSEQWRSADPVPGSTSGFKTPPTIFARTVPSDIGVPEGQIAFWKVRAWDGYQWSAWSTAGAPTGCYFTLDFDAPAPPTISSTDYPESNPDDPDDPWHDGVGRYGAFIAESSSDDVVKYRFGLNSDPTAANEAEADDTGAASIQFAPDRAGTNWVTVQAFDAAGNAKGSIKPYSFRASPGTPAKAHWKLDEPKDSSKIVDSAGTADAAVRGNPTLGVDGVVGTAMQLPGAEAHAETTSPVVDTSASFAVSAWARLPKDKPDHAGIIATQAGKERSGFELYYSSYFDRWIFNRYDADGSGAAIVRAQAPTAPTAGQWAHLVGVYDSVAAEIRLHVNGELVATTPYDKPWKAEGQVQIGAGWYGSRSSYFDGDVDDVRLFDRIVGGDEVRQLYVRHPVVAGRWKLNGSADRPPTPEAHYLLNEPAGATRAEDETGLYPAGANGEVAFGVSGRYGSAANFDGLDAYLVTTDKVVDTTQSFSVSAWAKLPATKPSKPGIIATQAGANKSGFELYYSSHFNRWIFNRYDADTADGANIVRAQSIAPPGDQWTHLVGVHDVAAQELRLYVNGKLQETTPYDKPWDAAGRLQIGAGWYGKLGSYFNGDIDDVRVFDRVVTGAEAAVLADGMPGVLSDDESVNGHHLTLKDGAYTDPSSRVGDGALALDGVDDHAHTDNAVLTTTESFTVAGWAVGFPMADAAVFSQTGGADSGFTLRFSTSACGGYGCYQFEMPETDGGSVTKTVEHSEGPYGSWEHVAIVYDAFRAEMRLYVNGKSQQASQLSGVAAFNAAGAFQLGRTKVGGAWGEPWPGQIDDVWAFRGVLSEIQIQKLIDSPEVPTAPGP